MKAGFCLKKTNIQFLLSILRSKPPLSVMLCVTTNFASRYRIRAAKERCRGVRVLVPTSNIPIPLETPFPFIWLSATLEVSKI